MARIGVWLRLYQGRSNRARRKLASRSDSRIIDRGILLVELTLQAMKTLSELMDRALDLDGETRTRWVADVSTGPHAALQPFLAEMLAKQADMETAFLVRPITLPEAPLRVESAAMGELRTGARIGPYVLQREVGHGGMGAVWLADRVDGALTRQVALKLPTIHLTDALAERFARERDILAQLTHPNIARLYDAGVSEAGRPYLALEYVEGKPITEHCDAINLPINERLRRFLQVASAVQYAHANLVIHRDLKPSNILVSEDGQVHLLDFGIAKLLDDPKGQAAESELTIIAGRALTLDYASPEQVIGGAISTGSDLYSMGVVLYQLLTGQKPYQLKRGSRAELEEAILTTDAALMSDAARRGDEATAMQRDLSQERLARALSGDLDTIVGKAIKKDAAQRYATVAAFAEDIQRHLDGLPVEAQPDSWQYRTGKFVARNRRRVAASLAVVAALSAGLGAALWQANVATHQAQRADAAAATARGEKLRADGQALAALVSASRADVEAEAARKEAGRADAQSDIALREAGRADREAGAAIEAAKRAVEASIAAQREAKRSTAVQGFVVDLFSANSNDQKNAIELRKLNAKQLLDRGVERLAQAKDVGDELNAELYRLFGNLYENVQEWEAAKRMHVQSVVYAARAYGKESKHYAMAVLERAVTEGRLWDFPKALFDEAHGILSRVAPESVEMAQLLYRYAEGLDNNEPSKSLAYAQQSSAMLERLGASARHRALAEGALAVAFRRIGAHDRALPAYQRSSKFYAEANGRDSVEYGESLIGIVVSLRELLRLREAHAVAVEMSTVLRPFRGESFDATPQGRWTATTIAELGNVDEATNRLSAVHASLKDVDGQPHPFKSSVSNALSGYAAGRDDTKRALELALRARSELGNKGSMFIANSHAYVASAALAAGEVETAEAAVREARALEKVHGLSAGLKASFAQYERRIASMRGAANVDAPVPAAAVTGRPFETWSPHERLLFALNRASAAIEEKRWDEVLRQVEPWLKADSPYELSARHRANALDLAAHAAAALKQPDAALLIDRAEAALSPQVIPTSPRLANLRALRLTVAAN